MAKKHPIYRLHKIKIHNNRWLIWAIAYVFLVWMALIGYIQVSNINFDTQQITAENNFIPWRGYSDHAMGFNIKYPKGWSIEANSDSSISFIPGNSDDSGVTIAEASLSSEKPLRKSLKIVSEVNTTVDGVSGTEITNQLTSDHSESVVLVQHNEKLYVIRGTKNLVDQLLLTFNFE